MLEMTSLNHNCYMPDDPDYLSYCSGVSCMYRTT